MQRINIKVDRMNLLKGTQKALFAVGRALRSVWRTLGTMVVVGCIFSLVVLALIAEASERLSSITGSALATAVKRLGDHLL